MCEHIEGKNLSTKSTAAVVVVGICVIATSAIVMAICRTVNCATISCAFVGLLMIMWAQYDSEEKARNNQGTQQ